jgi:hypothetical protein
MMPRKPEDLTKIQGSKYTKFSIVKIGLAGQTLTTQISESKILNLPEMDMDI